MINLGGELYLQEGESQGRDERKMERRGVGAAARRLMSGRLRVWQTRNMRAVPCARAVSCVHSGVVQVRVALW